MSLLSVRGVSKKEGNAFVLKEASFQQENLQKLAIAGATGSGKSTLLKIIAGLAQPDEGAVYFEDQRVLGPNERLLPGHPSIAYLSQHFELRNHYRVEELLAYANKLSQVEAEKLYHICRIDHLLQRKNVQLSGGERKRIALARLVVGAPKMLILDEPFSNLDAVHTGILKQVIKDIADQLQITCLLVSHDGRDALSWADEIIVLEEGKVVQKGTPQKIYRQPVNEYVAGLFGAYNLVPPTEDGFFWRSGIDSTGKRLFLRPDQLQIVADTESSEKGLVEDVAFCGAYQEVKVNVGGVQLTILANSCLSLQRGERVGIAIRKGDDWYL